MLLLCLPSLLYKSTLPSAKAQKVPIVAPFCGSRSADTCFGEFFSAELSICWRCPGQECWGNHHILWAEWTGFADPSSGASMWRLSWISQMPAPGNLNDDESLNPGELIRKVKYRKGQSWHLRKPESCAISECGAAETRVLQREHVRRERSKHTGRNRSRLYVALGKKQRGCLSTS